ncbi:MAG: FkbM family methyltransferase [Lentisphaerae bacterium]|nr:FkbM family methyltransferase [Lentisphaerota bacterium]
MKPLRTLMDGLLRKSGREIRRAEGRLRRNEIDKNTYYDVLTQLVMKKVLTPTSICVDVGCHAGAILQLMMKQASQGTFLAFEPIPDLYQELTHNFNNPRVHIYNLALSDTAGTSTFNHVISNPGYSGLKKRPYDRPQEEDRQIEVRTETLDTILNQQNIRDIALMKIDVEGAELQVMKGAQSCIKRCKPVIVFEHGLGASDVYGTRPEDVYELLHNQCGLDISTLSVFLKDGPALSADAFAARFYEGKDFFFIAHPCR